MAIVYLAQDIKLQRPVAIKVMRAELADLLGRERFAREIEIAAGLQHPNILPLYESGTAGSLLYYVMRYVEGESLRARLEREKQLRLDDALRIAHDVAEALAYAHSRGIVHRDIKPENILLAEGHALVADFGIARAITEAGGSELTTRGIAVGTPAYMSPEQGSGQDTVDGRSDVYALGCVVYEMLAGEPPFSGRTAQAVIARHLQERPPSLRVVRPTISLGVQRTIETALAKVPADRYATATEFMVALERARSGRTDRVRLLLRAAVGLAVLGALGVAWRLLIAPGRPLDPNRVVVFPLAEAPAEATAEGTGVAVALILGSALEYTEPLQWIDGLPLLDAQIRQDVSQLTGAEARRISRARGARWYLDGAVVRLGDSATVVLRLNDAKGDSVVGRASATMVATQAPQAGLAAVNQILPRLLSPGRRIDLSALAERRPAAVASWLQGEREYRRSNFRSALDYLRRAVGEDSALAVAALRAAQAASWLNDMAQAEKFIAVALRHVALLPARTADFARGLEAYLDGQADSATYWLGRALEVSPQWTEAHMALGEVYYHLLPLTAAPLDSLAQREFIAAAADSEFSLPRLHLAEIAIRGGDPERAERAIKDFVRLAPGDAEEAAELSMMLTCVSQGRRALDWQQAASGPEPIEALRAAKVLAVAGASPGCAEDGFRAIFRNGTTSLGYRWGAFLGLQGLLAAEGRLSELGQLIDSAVASGLTLASQLYILDALGGVGVDSEATAEAMRLTAELNEKSYPFSLWLLGEWRAHSGDEAGVESVRTQLSARASSTENRWIQRLADALGARVLLLRGDTAAALVRLRALLPVGRRDRLEWDIAESLAPDRLLDARLLLGLGHAQDAIDVASMFDHPSAVVFLPYLPASLTLRREAVRELGRQAAASYYEQRLERLGRPYAPQDPSIAGTGIP